MIGLILLKNKGLFQDSGKVLHIWIYPNWPWENAKITLKKKKMHHFFCCSYSYCFTVPPFYFWKSKKRNSPSKRWGRVSFYVENLTAFSQDDMDPYLPMLLVLDILWCVLQLWCLHQQWLVPQSDGHTLLLYIQLFPEGVLLPWL